MMDVLKALWRVVSHWPRKVLAVPARIEKIEAMLAERKARNGPLPTECPKCGDPMEFVQERDHMTFESVKVHSYRCVPCALEVTRLYRPGEGYV